jgi:WD40 repeat protein
MKSFFLFLPCILVFQLANAQTAKLETVIQKGHNASVKAIAISPDGKYVATGSRDKSAKLWDLTSGIELRSFLGHGVTVNGIEFSPDGKLLATSSADNSAKVWNVASGKQLFSSLPDEKYLTDVVFTPDAKFIVAAGYGDSAQVWDFNSGKLIRKIAVNSDQGSGYGISLAFSPDGKWLAIGEDNKTARVFNAETWELKYTFKPGEGWCGGCGTLISFSSDSRYLLKLSHNASVEKFDLGDGKSLKVYGEPFDDIAGVSFSPDGKTIMAAGGKEITLWDSESGALKLKFKNESGLNDVIFSKDGKLLLSANDDNTASAWLPENGEKKIVFTGILNQIEKGGINYDASSYWESHIAKYIRLKNNFLIAPDGKSLIRGKTGTQANLWDIASGEPRLEYTGHEKAVLCFDFSKDGKFLLTGDGAGKAILWEAASGKKLRMYDGHREPLFNVKFSPDESEMVTSSWDATAVKWNVKTGEKLNYIDLDNNSAFSMAFTPDGLYMVTGSLGKKLDLWEPDSKTIVKTFIGHTDVVSSIVFSQDKQKIMLTASWDGTARMWDISTGMMLKKFKGHQGAVHCAIYSADGKSVISGGDDRIIRFWDINSSKLVKTLEGHQAEITSISTTSDGKMLISASLDGVIKFWDLEKGKEFYEHIYVGQHDWMAKTIDGYFNATPGARGAIHFVRGMESYQTDQFFEKFYRPDLLPQMFKNRGETGQMKGVEDILKTSPPPIVKIGALAQGPDEAVIYVKIQDEGGGVDEIKLMHNGKRIPLHAEDLKLPGKKGEFSQYEHRLGLVGGVNTFSVSGFSKERVESPVAAAEIFSESKEKSATCHIFAIGIDKYRNSNLTLNYARDDAEAFVKIINEKSKEIFQKVVVHSLYDENATRKQIIDTLDRLASLIHQNDVFIFFYAGHGSMTDNRFFFIPMECTRLYDISSLPKEGLEATVVQEKLRDIKALKQIIIMDACQSGGSVELLASRGSLEEKAIAQLSRSAGIHVLASAGSEQSAKELGDLGHGLFTYVLIQALSGAADGAPKDGKITVYELKSYLDDQVPVMNQKYSGKAQYPYTFSRGHDFPIVLE